MKRFAVFGNPIAHSLSPIIHQAFAAQFGIGLSYEKIQTPLGELKTKLTEFKNQGGVGANITAPLKLEAAKLCDHLFDAAKQSNAVNTLLWEDDQSWGDNTDGEGLVRDLTLNLGLSLQDKRILILGAGGAVQSILFSLLALSPASILIVNRTHEKAAALCQHSPVIFATSYDTLSQNKSDAFDIVINATSASLQDIIPPLAPRWIQNTIAVDLVYRLKQQTIFMKWAKTHGASAAHDGLGMLVEQAALGFFRWHQQRPNTKSVIKYLSKC